MDIPLVQKICTVNASENCIGQGPKESFRGSYCKQCYKKYLSNYYVLNREKLLAKANARYVPNGNPRGRRSLAAPVVEAPAAAPVALEQ